MNAITIEIVESHLKCKYKSYLRLNGVEQQNNRVARYTNDNPGLCENRSWQPFSNPQRTDGEIKEIVAMVRLSLYNKDLPCGNRAIQCELEDMAVQPVPSLSTISRILRRCDLTHCRTGRYEEDEKI